MILTAVFSAVLCVAAAAPSRPIVVPDLPPHGASVVAAPVAVVSSQSHAQDELGQYSYSYSNPLSSKVETKTVDGVTRGGYSYLDSHGLVQSVNYVSDDVNGFRVAASNLPLGPVTPQEDEPLVAEEKAKAVAALHDAAIKDSALVLHENEVVPPAPVVYHEAPVVHHEAPAIHLQHQTPVVHQEAPLFQHAAPAVHHEAPTVHLQHEAPLFQHVAPVAHHEAPLVHHEAPAVHVQHETPSFQHAAPVVRHEAPLVHHEAPAVHLQHAAPVVHHEAPLYHHAAPVSYSSTVSPALLAVSTPAPPTYVSATPEAPVVHVTPAPYRSSSLAPPVDYQPSPAPSAAHSYATVELDSYDIPAPAPAPGAYFRPSPAVVSHASLSAPEALAYEEPALAVFRADPPAPPAIHVTPAPEHSAEPVYAPVAAAPAPVVAAPVVAAPVAVVSSQSHAQDELGQYSYSYSNPLSSKVETKTVDGVTRGGYSYLDSHGLIQSVNYVSDDVNGFRVAASNLPTGTMPVEVPDSEDVAIAKQLFLAEHAQ